MHIGFLLPEYPHEKLPKAAGIGTSTRNLIQALVALGIKISIFTYFQDEDDVIQEDSITIHKIKLKKYPVLTWKLNEGLIEKYINKIIKKDKIDVLEVVDWTGISANMKFNVPQVMRLHGTDTFFCHLANREVKKSNFKRERKAFLKADKHVAVSQFVADTTNQLFQTKKQSIIIPNGISTDEFKVKEAQLEPNTILYFGTLIRKKGLFELAKIFNLVVQDNPNAKLILLGNDAIDIHEKRSTWECMQELFSEEAKAQVSYLGKVPYEAMQEHIAKANVCVFPSLAESFGMVTIEAMAMEKAIVNTNYPWAKEIMEDGISGYLADPKNHQVYASKINQLLNDVTLAAMMAKEARKVVVEKFDIIKLAQQNIKVYQSLIQGNEV